MPPVIEASEICVTEMEISYWRSLRVWVREWARARKVRSRPNNISYILRYAHSMYSNTGIVSHRSTGDCLLISAYLSDKRDGSGTTKLDI
jgi:hypothetical protein